MQLSDSNLVQSDWSLDQTGVSLIFLFIRLSSPLSCFNKNIVLNKAFLPHTGGVC